MKRVKFKEHFLKQNERILHSFQVNIQAKTELSRKCAALDTSLGSTRTTGIADTTCHMRVNMSPHSACVSDSFPISIGYVSCLGIQAAHEDK
jgi:hypothetical protein